MVKHNEAIRGHKMLRAFIHPRQYSFLASAGCTALGAKAQGRRNLVVRGQRGPSIFEANPSPFTLQMDILLSLDWFPQIF